MTDIKMIKPTPKPRASKQLNNSLNSSNSDQTSNDSLNAKTADSQSNSSLSDAKIEEEKDDENLSLVIDEPQLTFRDQNTRNSDLIWFPSGIHSEHSNIDAVNNLYPDLSDFYHDNSFFDDPTSQILERPNNLELSCAQVDEAFEEILSLNDENNENCKLEFNETEVFVPKNNDVSKSMERSTENSTSICDRPPLPPILMKIARSPISVPHSVLGAPDAANVCYVGWLTLFKMNNIRKNEYLRRWCVLHDGTLIFFNDETDEKASDTIDCRSILFVSAKNNELSSPSSAPADPLFSFDLYYFIPNNQKVDHLQLLADSDEDRCVWITFLSRCLIASDASEMCQKVDRAGSVFLKKGTTADWECGWMIMIKSTLLYSCENDQCSYEIDVRKIIRLKNVDNLAEGRRFSKSASAFVIATEGSSLYIQTRHAAITEAWKNALQSMLCQRTSMISEQRLTLDDVPVIVEKCVNFIAVHGINVEGIHRLSGTSSKVRQLFDDFQRDPYSVHLKIEDYCVHDVASVLRKFLRQLKEPLITIDLRSSFIETSCIQEAGTRHLQCKLLLRQLPVVNYRTLRKILSHLKQVADNCQTNMMNVQNVSAIFGPTLFTVDRDDIEGMSFTSTSQAILLTADMILYFNWLFDVEEAELAKEIIIQQVAKDLTQHQTKKKLAGELLFSIYTDHRDGACFNMQITKKLMASEVCRFAVERNKVNFTSADEIGLFEVVCRGELERLISPDESVLDVVSRWTTWSLEERASNYLILKSDYVTNHVKDMAFGQTLYPTCEVTFAENRSFRKCFFKYVQGTIAQLKDAKSTKHLKEWNCDDLLWYFGCEMKRQPPKKFNLTFITKDDLIKRSKTNPFFGRTMCFKSEKDLYKWLCTVLLINVNIPF